MKDRSRILKTTKGKKVPRHKTWLAVYLKTIYITHVYELNNRIKELYTSTYGGFMSVFTQ